MLPRRSAPEAGNHNSAGRPNCGADMGAVNGFRHTRKDWVDLST